MNDTSAGASLAARMVETSASALPTSFNTNGQLFVVNLFLMTAFMCLGLTLAVGKAQATWRHRAQDRMRHPVTIWRLAWLVAGAAACLRCGGEAMNLWAWNPADPATTARVLMAKRWIDPIALACAGGWMLLVMLSDEAMERALTKAPFRVEMWANPRSFGRPAAIAVLSLIAAVGVTCTR